MPAEKPRWLDDNESRAWRGLIRMNWLLDAAIGRDLLADAGLSHPDYQVLVVLSEAPGRRLRMSDLAERLVWTRSRLSHQAGRMELRGLVRRQACAGDARGATAVLTPAGWRAIRKAAPGHVASVRRHLFDHLDDAEVRSLARLAERVAERLSGDSCDGCGSVSSTASLGGSTRTRPHTSRPADTPDPRNRRIRTDRVPESRGALT